MWYWIIRVILIVFLKCLFRFRVEGIENLPKKTNFILAANHNSFLDPLVIIASIPRRIYWITLKDVYETRFFKRVVRLKEALPTGRSSEKAIDLLIKNHNVALFPEGTRSHNGELGEFRRGAALLALKTGRPVVPSAILGAYEAFPRTAKFPKLAPITIKIGRPQYLLKEFDDIIDDIYLQEGTLKIKNTIKEMLYAG